MTREEAKARLAAIIEDVFEVDASEVDEDFSRDTCDEWDSLGQITLLVSVENEFGVKFSTEQMAVLSNVGAILDVLETVA